MPEPTRGCELRCLDWSSQPGCHYLDWLSQPGYHCLDCPIHDSTTCLHSKVHAHLVPWHRQQMECMCKHSLVVSMDRFVASKELDLDFDLVALLAPVPSSAVESMASHFLVSGCFAMMLPSGTWAPSALQDGNSCLTRCI